MQPLIIVLAVAAVAIFIGQLFRTQNRLAPLRERINETASNIKTCEQKRDRLIKRLLEIAATYASHEKGVHEQISSDFHNGAKAASAYVSHLMNTFPALRADQTYMSAMQDLTRLESEFQQKFEEHNAHVRAYNSVRLSFPNDLFGPLCDFKIADYLNSTDSIAPTADKATKRPTVKPRFGMRFRDTRTDSLSIIVVIDATTLWMKFDPPRTTNEFEWFCDIDLWMEEIEKGYYEVV